MACKRSHTLTTTRNSHIVPLFQGDEPKAEGVNSRYSLLKI